MVITHYAGGLVVERGSEVTTYPPGWPMCVRGRRALKIRTERRQSILYDEVSCKTCLRILERAGKR